MIKVVMSVLLLKASPPPLSDGTLARLVSSHCQLSKGKRGFGHRDDQHLEETFATVPDSKCTWLLEGNIPLVTTSWGR